MRDPKKRCIELAEKSTFHTRHGAVVVYDGHIIGSGYNINLHHDSIKVYNEYKTLHAEMIAILRVKNKRLLKHSAIFVARIDPQGKPIMSKPCAVCMTIIRDVWNIKNIFYTNENGEWVKLLL